MRTKLILIAALLSYTCFNAQTLDYYNLQFPLNGSIDPVGALTVYAQAYEPGVTEAAGQGTGVVCWIGVNATDTDPSTWDESAWTLAPFFGQAGNNDEFSLAVGNGFAPGTYYYASRFQLDAGPLTYGGINNSGSPGGAWDGSTNINGTLTVDDPTVDFCNLQFPESMPLDYGASGTAYAQAYEPGVTEAAGQGIGLTCWIGVNSADTDPSTWDESAWTVAPFFSQAFNNDEFSLEIGQDKAPGTYYYASRFQYNGGSYSYGGTNSDGSGGGNFWDGVSFVSGTMTVGPIPAIYINEVDADDAGSDDEGFVELYGPANESLDGLVLVFYNGTSDVTYRSYDLDGWSLDANGFFVLGNAAVANVDSVVSGDFLQNGADAVVLYVGDGADFPNGTSVDTTAIVDALVYDTDDADDAGLLVLLNSGQAQVNENGNGDKDIHSNSRVPDGGTQRNTDTYTQQAVTPGETNVIPECSIDAIAFVSNTPCNGADNTYTATISITYTDAPATGDLVVNGQNFTITTSPQSVTLTGLVSNGADVDVTASFSIDTGCTLTESALFTAPEACLVNTIVINEIDYDQDSTDDEEFIELYNTGLVAVDLSVYTLELINGSTGTSYKTVTFPSVLLAAGDYYVICFGPNANPYCDQSETGSIQNGAPDAIALNLSGGLVDAVSYEGNVAGYVEGTGIASGDEDRNNRSLLRIPDGADTNDNDSDFVLACISPGAANVICPENDDCEDALMLTSSTWGTASWDTLSVLNATESMVGCAGDANDDVWFSFVAGDSNDAIIAHDPNGLNDLVIELYDACGGTSLGCYNNYSAAQLETVLPGSLNTGDTYVFRVYDSSSGEPVSSDVRVLAKTWADGAIRSQFCGITDYSTEDYITPERQDLNELYPLTTIHVSGYGVRLIDPIGEDTIQLSKTGQTSMYFQLSELDPEYNTVYDASARHRLKISANGEKNFYWSDWGPSCTIGVAGVQETKIRDVFCDNVTGYHLEQLIQADFVQNATAYRFTFTEGANTFVETNASYGVFLYELEGLELGKSYSVTAQARVNGEWSSPGAPCTINMASEPQITEVRAQYCDGTYEYPHPNYILAEYVYGASAYTWSFTPSGGGTELTETTSGITLAFHLTELSLEPGVTYDVRVKATVGGIEGAYGSVCAITIQNVIKSVEGDEVVEFSKGLEVGIDSGLHVYPNPNTGKEFLVDMPEEIDENSLVHITLFDILGRPVHQESRAVAARGTTVMIRPEIALSEGMYLIEMQSAGRSFTSSVIVE